MSMDRVRQFVDGELPAQEAAAFERALAADEGLRALVAFERSLRRSVSEQILAATPAAPPELRSRVRSILAPAPRQAVPARGHDGGGLARFFAGPRRANAFAVAACLLIVASAVIVGVFGDEWGLGLRRPVNSSSDVQMDVMAGIAQQAGVEHVRCMSNADALATKMHFRDAGEIQDNLSARLGVRVPVFDLTDAGLDLVGGSECSLGPLPRSTVHLLYRDRAGRGGLSIFLQPNQGQYGAMQSFLETGMIYAPGGCAEGAAAPTSMVTDGRLVYIMRACDPAILEAGSPAILREIASRN